MLDYLVSLPVLVKVLTSLAVMLVANLKRLPLSFAILSGALLLAAWSGHSASKIAMLAAQALISSSTLLLLAVIYLIISLSNQMQACGSMQTLVDTVRKRLPHRTAIALLPALIGFLPMPGGAIFSAPMVGSCDNEGNISSSIKTQINYWFRHIWEYWWPMYPGVLLGMEITGLAIWQVMLYGVPLTMAAIIAGYFFLLRKVPAIAALGEKQYEKRESLILLLCPILLVVIVYALFRIAYYFLTRRYSSLPEISDFLPIAVGVLTAIVVLQYQRPAPWNKWKKILIARKTFVMVSIVAVMQIYGAFINSTLPSGSTMMAIMDHEMNSWGIPVWAIVVIIPFISGLTMGISLGFVGASFPIVFSLLGVNPTFGTVISTAALAYGFGYLGMMFSPVHVCLIVSNEHFQTSIIRTLSALIAPGAFVGAVLVGLYFLLRFIFP